MNGSTDTLDTVLAVTSQFTDIILYQMHGRFEVQEPAIDRWHRATDQPIINGDAAFAMITDEMPRPYGPVTDNPAQCAAWADEFFRKAFAQPDFVGWHYCGVIDASQRVASKQDRQHAGLIRRTLSVFTANAQAMCRRNVSAYVKRLTCKSCMYQASLFKCRAKNGNISLATRPFSIQFLS